MPVGAFCAFSGSFRPVRYFASFLGHALFIKYLSDIAFEAGWRGTKLATLLPMSAAIGASSIIAEMKSALLQYNTLEAVFSLPPEIFYPGSSVQAVCMLFTLNKPHFGMDGKPNKSTFFGYYRDDGFKKKRKLVVLSNFMLMAIVYGQTSKNDGFPCTMNAHLSMAFALPRMLQEMTSGFVKHI